jgi:NAD(P)-dependent dehydrogenase (short-subunit alcohol dehydrogenase family)
MLASKVALVTGGSRGIGAGIVRSFLREGATVVYCGLPAHEPKEAAAARSTFVPCDVSQPRDLERLVEGVLLAHGRLDVLVNNAGTHPPLKPIDDISLADFRALLDINLLPYFYSAKLALPALRRVRGAIVNVSSMSGFFGQEGSCTYCASKGAITAFTKGLAIDEAAHGVRVNALSPGNVWTPLWEEHVAGPDAAQHIATGSSYQLLGRMGTEDEVGEAALHLATATYTTGIEYLVSGGAELGYAVKARSKGL